MDLQPKRNFLIDALYYTVLIVIFTLVLKFSFSYLLPVLIACGVAAFSQKLSLKISKSTHLPRSACAVVTVVVIYLSVIVTVILLLYSLVIFARSVSGDFTTVTEKIKYFTDEIGRINSEYIYKFSPEVSNFLNRVLGDLFSEFSNKVAHILSNFMTGLVSKIPSLFFSFVVSLVASCYIAKDYNGWVGFLKGLCSERVVNITQKIKTILKNNTFALLKGYMKLYVITFAVLFLGLLILRVKHAFIIAVLTAVVDLLPVLGTGTVLVPWAIFSLLNGNYFLGLGIIVLYIFVIFVRNFSEPKVVGAQIGINPLFTLISMFIGLRLFGFWGIIILPLTLITVIKYYKEEMQ